MANEHTEWFVGVLALAIAGVISFGALGSSSLVYRLRSVAAMRARYGERAACGVLLVIAALLVGCGAMILTGTRPGYAVPAQVDDESP